MSQIVLEDVVRDGEARATRLVAVQAARRTPRRRAAILYAALLVSATLVLFPLLYALSIAVQGPTVSPRILPRLVDWSVFVRVFEKERYLGRWILNSLVVSVVVTYAQVTTSAFAGYALAMFRFRGSKAFLLFLLGPACSLGAGSWRPRRAPARRSSCTG